MDAQCVCPSCGAITAESSGPVHRYLESSPGCWAAVGQVLEKEYSDCTYAKNHKLSVDAYALQHPGNPSSQTISSAAVHLARLCQIIEHGMTTQDATEFMQRFTRHKANFIWLKPPEDFGNITVVDMLVAKNGDEHTEQVAQWANETWLAWSAHHDQINSWTKQYGSRQ